MSSLALMRWLEGAPGRYDTGMRWLTLGRDARVREVLAGAVRAEDEVVEIGCGTGALTARLVARGARVTAVEQSPDMLDLARARLARAPSKTLEKVEAAQAVEAVTWKECTAAEIDGLPAAGFDACVAAFALSEMSASERAYVLEAARERLRPDGVLAVGDEVVPRGLVARGLVAALRVPQAAAGWLLAGSVSRPLRHLSEEIARAGFRDLTERRFLGGSLAAIVARRTP